MQGAGEEPKTWEVLLNCLREIGANEAMQSIERNVLKRKQPCMYVMHLMYIYGRVLAHSASYTLLTLVKLSSLPGLIVLSIYF